jgi:hypothetical protein
MKKILTILAAATLVFGFTSSAEARPLVPAVYDSGGCNAKYVGTWLTSGYQANCYALFAGGWTQFRARIDCYAGGSRTTAWGWIGSGVTLTTAKCVGGGTGHVEKR